MSILFSCCLYVLVSVNQYCSFNRTLRCRFNRIRETNVCLVKPTVRKRTGTMENMLWWWLLSAVSGSGGGGGKGLR